LSSPRREESLRENVSGKDIKRQARENILRIGEKERFRCELPQVGERGNLSKGVLRKKQTNEKISLKKRANKLISPPGSAGGRNSLRVQVKKRNPFRGRKSEDKSSTVPSKGRRENWRGRGDDYKQMRGGRKGRRRDRVGEEEKKNLGLIFLKKKGGETKAETVSKMETRGRRTKVPGGGLKERTREED